jgi:hypothetical protein
MASIPSAIRREKFSRNPNQAVSAVNRHCYRHRARDFFTGI